ncbi:MAG TPA: serine hydrolase domain-containing protein [Mycobacteriales bacterium]|nr:serine hydrolase domain-containing protein [Mycobacteriales bacterium]
MSVIAGESINALLGRARRDVDEGVLPSCQLALACDGEVVAAATFGAPDGSRYVTFSVTKAFSAGLAWLLIGDAAVSDQTRVAEVVPEFGSNGKHVVTIEHLLTHTAGFPRAPMRPEEGVDRERRLERFASWRLDWAPGSQTEYHATSAYWPLVEVVERVTGSDFRQVFAERIAAPLGLRGLSLGAAMGQQNDVMPVCAVGDATGAAETLGDRLRETGAGFLLRFNEPEVLAAGVPGAGAVATASDVALYYQSLLGPDDAVWPRDVVRDATSNVRNTLVDPLFNHPANRTLGLVVAGDDPLMRGFGRSVGPRAFGAMGVGGQIAWADPDSGLSFCYLTNGLDADVVGSFQRAAKLAGLAGRCAAI